MKEDKMTDLHLWWSRGERERKKQKPWNKGVSEWGRGEDGSH